MERSRKRNVLIISKDSQTTAFLSKILGLLGHEVHIAVDAETLSAALRRQNFKLLIVDSNLIPDSKLNKEGLMLLEMLRNKQRAIPVIIHDFHNQVSEWIPPQVSDRIPSLEQAERQGITQALSFSELSEQVNAVLRRRAYPSRYILKVEDLEFNPVTRKVTRAGREIKLSTKEFQVLHVLMARAGHEVTREELLREVWGARPGTDSNLVDLYINYLQQKIDPPTKDGEQIDQQSQLIHKARRGGYQIGRKGGYRIGWPALASKKLQ